MRIRSRYVAVVAATGLVLVVAACEKKSPTSPAPSQPRPTPTASIVRLELVAPSEIAPEETVQLRANAIKSDGSVENVSSQAQWTSTNSPVLQLSAPGLVTGKNRGEGVVSARFDGRSATAHIFVLPKGTFRLAGNIQDSGFGIADVTVTVTSGIGDGLTTLSHATGVYALYGVSGPVQLQVKKEGYGNAIQSLDVTAHRTYDFNMVTERPRTLQGNLHAHDLRGLAVPLDVGHVPRGGKAPRLHRERRTGRRAFDGHAERRGLHRD